MRAAVLANLFMLGACARGDAAGRPTAVARTTAAPDARPRAGVTQSGAGAPTSNTPTPPPPESVPDTPPAMRNTRLPFRYPGALYARRVQGNVTLRLWVDSAGRVYPESTRVAESSGTRLLDSAAVAGSVRLEFTPARHEGRPVAAPLLFPVHFRHPAGATRP